MNLNSIWTNFSDRLAAYDEKLRTGSDPNIHQTLDVHDTATDPKTSSLFDCLHLLDRAWPRAPSVESPTMPTHIGRFKLERVLGVGGFGVVYKAFDPTLRRQVALKVPRLHSLANGKLLARFEREARAAAALDHPNIVPIHETGQAGPVCYIAAAYCPGPNLAEWLKARTKPVPARIAAALVGKLAAAVQYSHSQGILHRDLKPSNVLIVPRAANRSGSMHDDLPFVPRLTDFGLAKLFDADLEEALSKNETQALGTPAYMAPEQTGKRESPVGQATDVYGLGVILYELLTGRPPFQVTSVADLFDQISNTEPVAPCRVRREIPRDLETICLKCLEKKSSRRFLTAQMLADELDFFLRGEPIVSRPVGLLDRTLRWCHRRPTVAALVGVSIASVISIVGLLVARDYSLTKYNADIANLNDDLRQAANRAKGLQRTAEENERQAKDALVHSRHRPRRAAAWKDEDRRVMTELLDRHRPTKMASKTAADLNGGICEVRRKDAIAYCSMSDRRCTACVLRQTARGWLRRGATPRCGFSIP